MSVKNTTLPPPPPPPPKWKVCRVESFVSSWKIGLQISKCHFNPPPPQPPSESWKVDRLGTFKSSWTFALQILKCHFTLLPSPPPPPPRKCKVGISIQLLQKDASPPRGDLKVYQLATSRWWRFSVWSTVNWVLTELSQRFAVHACDYQEEREDPIVTRRWVLRMSIFFTSRSLECRMDNWKGCGCTRCAQSKTSFSW